MEAQYYPFGLTMAGISSKALKPDYAENDKKYNGIELSTALGLNIYEAELRYLDPQIGRWWQVDPLIEKMEMWSPYASNYDNPIRYSDPQGDEGEECCGWFAGFLSNNTTIARSPIVEMAAKTGEVGAKTGEVTKPRFTPQQLQRFREGREIEVEQLAKHGLEKNNKPIETIDPKTGEMGKTIPDALKNEGLSTSEVKNVKSQGLTRQLRMQQKHSNDNGFSPELIINKGAKISEPLKKSSFDIKYYKVVPPAAKDGIIQGLPQPGSVGPAPKKPEPCGCACIPDCT